jgi:ubiquinone biosynthesis protein COQ9
MQKLNQARLLTLQSKIQLRDNSVSNHLALAGTDERVTSVDAPDWAGLAEQRLLDGALPHVARLGWTRLAMQAAARKAGLSLAEAELLAPSGPRDLAALLARRHDERALSTLSTVDPLSLKVRERIRAAVLARCQAAMEDGEATRRWCGFLALPTNAPLGLRLAWASADRLWRWAGDVATDENHYTKRLLLAEILISTLAVRLAMGGNAAAAHLEGRINAVMAFEKWKAGVKPSAFAHRTAGALARLRYGGRLPPVTPSPGVSPGR